jgi:hypothetical protein
MIARNLLTILSFAFASALLVTTLGSLAASGEPEETGAVIRNRVYARIILPMKPSRDNRQPVESWITEQLTALGKKDIRAVTDWVCLPEQGEENAHVWDAVVEDKHWGCPVVAHPVERLKNGTIRVNLTGWAPFPLEQSGMSLPDEIGSRTIAVVDDGKAYVVILVVPAPTEKR